MNDGADYIIQTADEYRRIADTIHAFNMALILDGPICIHVERYSPKRSTSANALYWQWLTVMAKHFSKKGQTFTKDDMHDLMRHRFLGYENRVIGKTELKPQLKSSASLSTREMCEYMTKIDAWAADNGCLLPRPEDNDYSEWQRAVA